MGVEEYRILSALTDDEHLAVADLVSERGEVTGGHIRRGLKSAICVCVCYRDGKLIGTSALKRPLPSYVERISRAAGIAQLDCGCLEFGYVAVDKDHERQGIGKRVSEMALSLPEAQGQLIATTRVDNKPMQQILSGNGFRVPGDPFPSSQRDGVNLQLFVRDSAR